MQKESPQKSKTATNDAPNEPDQIHYFEGGYNLNYTIENSGFSPPKPNALR